MQQETFLIEGVNRDMIARTELKFRTWDRTVELNLMEEGTEQEKRIIAERLSDPTVYAYAFFRDDKGEPLKLYPYQDTIINDHHKRIIFAAANQIGKSITLCVKGVTYALNHPGHTVLMTSKTLPQAKDLLRQIKNLLTGSVLEFKYDIGDTDTTTEIYFRHFDEYWDEETQEYKQRELKQSRIICVPATEGALGYPVHLALVDELAFYENGEYFYKQILQPRTYHTKGQIIVFSNPFGQQGIFWSLWNSKRFHKYRFTYLDCPANSQAEFDELAEELTQQEIDSTLMAVFTSPVGAYISLEERRVMQEDRPNHFPVFIERPIYIFFDFAKTADRTVRVAASTYGLDESHPGVFVHEMLEYDQGTPYNVIVDELEGLINRVGRQHIAMVGWDNTGVGKGIEDFIRRIEDLGVACVPVEFSLENKSRIYTSLKLLIEKNVRGRDGIKLPFIKSCDKQLAALRFKTTSRGYLQVHHENEKDRDDYPDALAGVVSLIVQPDNPPVTAVVIDGEWERKCAKCNTTLGDEETNCSQCGEEYEDWLGVV
jgi:hypothetical protein